MTLYEFDNDIEDFPNLLNFCYDNNLYVMDDVRNDEYFAEWVQEVFADELSGKSIEDMFDWISEAKRLYNNNYWLQQDGSGETGWYGADFTYWKDTVREAAIEDGLFDNEDEEFEDIDGIEDIDLIDDPVERYKRFKSAREDDRFDTDLEIGLIVL